MDDPSSPTGAVLARMIDGCALKTRVLVQARWEQIPIAPICARFGGEQKTISLAHRRQLVV